MNPLFYIYFDRSYQIVYFFSFNVVHFSTPIGFFHFPVL